ncbi:MAG: phosphoenolpyruvate synthase [Gammaproteobacteria bacterium]|nr:phosphoenolpyruvate synthase [Gammaproteobacteria bacterium]
MPTPLARRLSFLLFALAVSVFSVGADTPPLEMGAAEPLDPKLLRQWVDQMKREPRGPFSRIRWFCEDGAILPPTPGACSEHGGGVQHGEWNTRILAMRNDGYLVANLLADIQPLDFVGPAAHLDRLRQILLEQFLIANDDGFLFRQARYYRGALQIEDEHDGARQLLLALVEDPDWLAPRRYLLLREAARLLPVRLEPSTAGEARQLAIEIADKDPAFQPLRVKIHGIPDANDPQLVREHAASRGLPELAEQYARLAEQLEALYAPRTALRQLEALADETPNRALKAELRAAAARLGGTRDLAQRLTLAADYGADWRERIAAPGDLSPPNRIRVLLAGLAIEDEIYALGNRLVEEAQAADRATRLQWLRDMTKGLYAAGLLSARQRQAAEHEIAQLLATRPLRVEAYLSALRYLARVPQWAQRGMEFHFGLTVERWTVLTPNAVHYIPDRLRTSPLLAFTRVLDGLTEDANDLAGVRHTLFGREQATGLRALNPGLSRGTLLPPPQDEADFRRDGIYLLPSTTPELPRVAGILTRGEGSSLSHVQLLARNLGIPNVVVDDALLAEIEAHMGQPIVMAVSPRGAVEIAVDGPRWDEVFGRETLADDIVIEPDLDKLDLEHTEPMPLERISARDSGRTVGPKAANLGELRRNYPEAVSAGLAIPFGAFRALLDKPIAPERPDSPSAYDWLNAEYARLRTITEPGRQREEVQAFLAALRDWITHTDPGEEFRMRLRAAMTEVFGSAHEVGVFVRSDTNVEDLPGFTGAGLNRTVPNVVGFEPIVQAIQQVWASPFTERAYAWRQAHMPQPRHVYPAVLLLQTFPAQKSGVLVTADVESGDRHWLSIAVSEGVGGAVEGQAAEELRVRRADGETRLLAQASAPLRAEAAPGGGIVRVPASGAERVLTEAETEQLRRLADDVERRFPMPGGDGGLPAPADIEFGFRDGRLALFQIRPFVESARARRSQYLIGMDRAAVRGADTVVDLGVRSEE